MKDADINYTTDRTAMRAVGGDMWATGENYWSASHNVISYSSLCYFSVRYVYTSGVLISTTLCTVHSDGNASGDTGENGLRPCISLRSDVKVIGGGDGSEESQAYELGI